MCLSSSSLRVWISNNTDDPRMPSPLEMETALQIYTEIWPTLDHTRHYCVNPLILAVEILERAGVGQYPKVKRFGGEKGQRYTQIIDMMWDQYQSIRPKELS